MEARSPASPATGSETHERVLIMAPYGRDAAAMAGSLAAKGFLVKICGEPGECAREIGAGAGALLLTEEALGYPEIPKLLNALHGQPPWSQLPVIVLTRGHEPHLQQSLDLTAAAARVATLLERPISSATLLRSVQVALNSRRRQYQVRDLIEEQQRNQERLRDSENRLRFVTDHAPALIVHCDAEARFSFVNKPYAARFAMRPEDMVGKRIPEVVGAEAYESFRCHVEAALRGERVEFEERIPYAALGPRWTHAAYVPEVEGGEVVGFVGLIQDVTTRKAGEEAAARLAAIVASSGDAIVSKTLEGVITSWNAGAERMFGYSAAEMIGCSIFRLIPPELRSEEQGILAKIKSGVRIEHFETVRLTKDGRRLPISLTVSPIKDASGALIGASKIARDISERRAAEESLRQAKEQAESASRAKDNFLAALSHELRTPLTPVLMAASVLSSDGKLPEDLRETLGMIVRNTELEARLIDDLLDLTRITRGKLALRPAPCDIHSLVERVVEIVREDARAKGIEIALHLAATRSTLTGDPARLQQVFWNLLRNAVKFTPENGHIRIHSFDVAGEDEAEPRIGLEVRDDGIGFPAEAGTRIFEPFQQAASGQHQRFGGLGLGLAIAREVVDLHRGAIRGESSGEGHGATFVVELPLRTPQDASQTQSSREALRAASTGDEPH